MRAALALALAVAACSAPPAAQPVIAGQAAPPAQNAPAGPAPHIDWHNALAGIPGFTIDGLPALGRTGDIAVVAHVENDGGRGFPNLRIDVRDRRDRIVESIAVMTANEYERLIPDAANATAELTERIAAANRRLAALHAAHALAPMRAIKPPADLAIDFAARGWLAPSGQRCAQCPPCENPPYLDAVYQGAAADLLLVRVAYRGTDTCWEPSPQWHLVAR